MGEGEAHQTKSKNAGGCYFSASPAKSIFSDRIGTFFCWNYQGKKNAKVKPKQGWKCT